MLKPFLILSVFLTLALSCSGPVSDPQVARKPVPSPTLNKEELRLKIQEQLLRGENQHDGSSILESVGTIESVPALLKVLEDNPPDPNGIAVCTAGHAVDALEKITGAKPGYTYKEWKSWWDKYQKTERNLNRRTNSQAQ